jgi:hypothetical protein
MILVFTISLPGHYNNYDVCDQEYDAPGDRQSHF